MARPQVYWPSPIKVETSGAGVPVRITGLRVESVREQWLVEDRWWAPKPLQRMYFEVVLSDGRNLVVFREPPDGVRWYEQRA
jgi:hypothetical protein